MNAIAIIPARGGSKAIPRKNVLLVAGLPLVAHSVREALAARSIDHVVVSTDDAEIAHIARQHGAEVVWRPADISGDFARSEEALLHALETLTRRDVRLPEVTVFLQCTSPLTRAEDIDGTVEAMHAADADSALAVADFHYFLWKMDENGDAVGINHCKSQRQMRQEREPQLIETGAVYAMRTAGFLQAQHRFFGRTAMYTMPLERRHEIDEPVDLQVAEVLLREQSREQWQEMLPDPIDAVVMDFDGVLTDNRVLVTQEGVESVVCDRGDGLGLERMKRRGVRMLVLSKERNPVVRARCEKLGIPCAHGIDDKISYLSHWAAEHGVDLARAIYVGNDVNDVECMGAVGCGVAVADAHPGALAAAQIVLTRPGGHGAIRELTDLLEEKLKGINAMEGTLPIDSARRNRREPRIVEIAGRPVGEGCPVYVIGEIGINHNGDLELAKKMIDAAALAGCDAVKFQKRTPELCVPPEQQNVQRETPWGVMTYLEYRHRVEFSYEQYAEIDAYCTSKNITWFASCWDEPSVDFIEQFEPACYKLASAAVTDKALLEKHVATRRPIILSTGMSTMEQIRRAVSSLDGEQLLVAHATSTYPCPPEELNLRMIDTLQREFDCPIGFSGHEVGLSTTSAAVALGATFIERHITLDRAMWGSDQSASVEPWGLMRLVRDIRTIESALGDGVKRVYESERGPMKKLRRVA